MQDFQSDDALHCWWLLSNHSSRSAAECVVVFRLAVNIINDHCCKYTSSSTALWWTSTAKLGGGGVQSNSPPPPPATGLHSNITVGQNVVPPNTTAQYNCTVQLSPDSLLCGLASETNLVNGNNLKFKDATMHMLVYKFSPKGATHPLLQAWYMIV